MSDFPIISGVKLVKLLSKLGFEIVRQKGSHVFVKHRDGRTSVIPVHKGKDLKLGLLKKILKEVNISVKEFLKIV